MASDPKACGSNDGLVRSMVIWSPSTVPIKPMLTQNGDRDESTPLLNGTKAKGVWRMVSVAIFFTIENKSCILLTIGESRKNLLRLASSKTNG